MTLIVRRSLVQATPDLWQRFPWAEYATLPSTRSILARQCARGRIRTYLELQLLMQSDKDGKTGLAGYAEYPNRREDVRGFNLW